MTLAQIVEELEKGGLEFESRTPGREVNAALINLKGVVKVREGYALEDHEELFARFSAMQEPLTEGEHEKMLARFGEEQRTDKE